MDANHCDERESHKPEKASRYLSFFVRGIRTPFGDVRGRLIETDSRREHIFLTVVDLLDVIRKLSKKGQDGE